MNPQEKMARKLRELERRIETLEAREHPPAWVFATEDLELVDAGSAGATEQDWVEVTVGAVQGYLRVFATE